MVGKVFKFLSKETKGVHQAAYLLAVFTVLSQVLGLFRDRILAHTFGASASLDIYYAAFRIPDFIFVTVASLVSVSVLVPFLIRLSDRGGAEEKRLLDSVFTVFLMIIICVIGLAFVFMPQLLRLTAPGLDQDMLLILSRILLLSPLVLGISNLCGSVVQAHERFVAYALSPVLYNAGIIVGIIFFYPLLGLSGLVYGVVLGSVLHLLIQIPSLLRVGKLPVITFRVSWKLVGEVFAISIPRILTLASNHLVMLGLVGVASLMTVGSISIFTFAFNLQSVPMGIIGVSYSLAAFPLISRLYSEGKIKEFVNEVIEPIRHVIFWSIPVTILFIVLRAQIVRVILGSGEFDWDATRLTAAAAALFVVSVVFQNIALMLVRAHYASGRTRKPFYQAVAGAVGAFVIVWIWYAELLPVYCRDILEALFRVSGIQGTDMLILPLAFSVGAIIQALLLWGSFGREFIEFKGSFRTPIFQSLSASIIGGYCSYSMLQVMDDLVNINTLPGVFIQGCVAGVVGISVTAVILLALGNAEIRTVMKTLHSRIWKSKPITEDAHEVV